MWIHYFVCVNHFAKCREKQPVTVWELVINLLQCAILQWRGKWKSGVESVSEIRSPPKVNQFFWLVVGPPNHNTKFQWNQLIAFAVILHTDRMRDKLTKRHNVRLGGANNECYEWKPLEADKKDVNLLLNGTYYRQHNVCVFFVCHVVHWLRVHWLC